MAVVAAPSSEIERPGLRVEGMGEGSDGFSVVCLGVWKSRFDTRTALVERQHASDIGPSMMGM